MLEMSEIESQIIVAAQKGIAVAERPFAVLGERFGATEEDTIEFINRLRQSGEARRFGAVFDVRKLGYRSALCAINVPEDQMEITASKITPQTGITHVYHRGWIDDLPRDGIGGPRDNSWPNLWFTLAAPAKSFDDELIALRDACAPFEIHELPALKRFKIDVVFDVRTRDRDEKVEPRIYNDADAGLTVELNPWQQDIVKYFEGDIPVVADFYGSAAVNIGIPEDALMKTLSEWLECGVVRRIGLLLRHRRVGFKANGMCCWSVPDDQIREAGRRVSSCREVTHCYERPAFEGFPFNLFAMIHTTSWEKTQGLFQRISGDCGLSGGQLLLSVREFKKTSMQFFFKSCSIITGSPGHQVTRSSGQP